MDKPFPQNLSSTSERASAFTSRGSMTVEAALVVPLFFLAMLCLVYSFEIMAVRIEIRGALYSAGKEIGEQSYISSVLSATNLKQRIIDHVGKERIENSIIEDGADGLHCFKTLINEKTDVMQLSVEYSVRVPIVLFELPSISYEETLRIKGWTGNGIDAEEDKQREVVYITENGTVYHKQMSCTYLDVRVRGIIAHTIEEARNASGGKYYECELCGKGSHVGILYVSEYGTRYHTTLSCSKIKRNVYAIPLEDARGRKGCEKCVN